MRSKTRKSIYKTIDDERDYQDSKWGGQGHDDQHSPRDWSAFIIHYLGKAVDDWSDPDVDYLVKYESNLIKVAALTVAALEQIERYKADAE